MKTPTQQFIEDAIAGGWKGVEAEIVDGQVYTFGKRINEPEVLLDPLAWQAVGRQRGWKGQKEMTAGFLKATFEVWQDKQLAFIVYLQQGKTIDEALAAVGQGV
jgi:hypothetical protein